MFDTNPQEKKLVGVIHQQYQFEISGYSKTGAVVMKDAYIKLYSLFISTRKRGSTQSSMWISKKINCEQAQRIGPAAERG